MASLLGCGALGRVLFMVGLSSERPREMAHWLNCLLQPYESLALHSCYGHKNQSVGAWACN